MSGARPWPKWNILAPPQYVVLGGDSMPPGDYDRVEVKDVRWRPGGGVVVTIGPMPSDEGRT